MKKSKIGSRILNRVGLFGILIGIGLTAVNLTACGPADRFIARSNALRYVEEKYGFKPSIVGMERNYSYSAVFSTSSPTHRWRVAMEYEGEVFNVGVSDRKDDVASGCDDYEKDLLLEEMESYLTETIPAEKICIMELTTEANGMEVRDVDSLLKDGILSAKINTYGMDMAALEAWLSEMEQNTNTNVDFHFTDFREEEDFDTYGSVIGFDSTPEVFIDLVDNYISYSPGGYYFVENYENIAFGDYVFTYDTDYPVSITDEGENADGSHKFDAIGGEPHDGVQFYVTVPSDLANYVSTDETEDRDAETFEIWTPYQDDVDRSTNSCDIWVHGEASFTIYMED